MNYYALQARIERLRAHIRRAGKRGDQQALTRLVQLRQEAERHRVSSLKTDTLTLMLQELYNSDTVLKALEPSPWFAFIKKDPACPPDRFYVVQDNMPKARCPDCDTLQYITPNGVDPKLSNKRQRIMLIRLTPNGTVASI